MWKPIANFNNEIVSTGSTFIFAGVHSQEEETLRPVKFSILQLRVEEMVENPWTKDSYVSTFVSIFDGNMYSAEDIISLCSSYCTFEDFMNDISEKKEEAPKIRARGINEL